MYKPSSRDSQLTRVLYQTNYTATNSTPHNPYYNPNPFPTMKFPTTQNNPYLPQQNPYIGAPLRTVTGLYGNTESPTQATLHRTAQGLVPMDTSCPVISSQSARSTDHVVPMEVDEEDKSKDRTRESDKRPESGGHSQEKPPQRDATVVTGQKKKERRRSQKEDKTGAYSQDQGGGRQHNNHEYPRRKSERNYRDKVERGGNRDRERETSRDQRTGRSTGMKPTMTERENVAVIRGQEETSMTPTIQTRERKNNTISHSLL